MEKEILSPAKELNTIKLSRGQRGSYGWEIKLVGDCEKDIIGRIKDVDEELNLVYNLNLKKEEN